MENQNENSIFQWIFCVDFIVLSLLVIYSFMYLVMYLFRCSLFNTSQVYIKKGSFIIQSNANLQLPLYAIVSRQQGVNITGVLPKDPESYLQVYGLGSCLRAQTSESCFRVWCLGSCLRIQGLWTCLTVRVPIFAVCDSNHGYKKRERYFFLVTTFLLTFPIFLLLYQKHFSDSNIPVKT